MAELAWDRSTMLAGTVAFLAVERTFELALSHRNLTRLRASGAAHEASSGAAEYALMVAVHTLFLFCPLLEVKLRGMRGPDSLALAGIAAIAAAQVLRWWTIRTLGLRWNARAVVAPSLGVVHGGPYRFLRHPNYLAVMVEFAALPLVGGTWLGGGAIFLANTWLLARRRRQEEELLARIPGWREGFER
ncbi:MAG TPA: isoprenylcysteine carboxylmethyltransferase family protein [Planctomycetota bacterium]|nr:isoprenylcysteine carboxylmethyltransferase family protein [Planctomycetota bacterium]